MLDIAFAVFAIVLFALVLMFVVLPIAAFVLAVRASRQADRLETQVRQLTSQLRSAPGKPAAAAPPGPTTAAPKPSPPVQHPPQASRPAAEQTVPVDDAPQPASADQPTSRLTAAATSGPQPTTPAPAPTPAPVQAQAATAPGIGSTSACGVSDAAAPPPSPPPPPTPPRSADGGTRWEERLGARLPVWLGAIALALAAAYLMKYSFDRDLLRPEIRIAMGLAAGLAMLGLGEWLGRRAQRIGQGVTAAGIATLFTSVLAATSLYDLVDPVTGFLGMAVVTALAVVLSLRQGPLVALLGMLGGFLTPALLGTEGQHPAGLFSYLMLLQVGLLVIVRQRAWWPLGLGAMLGGMLWVVLWIVLFYEQAHSGWAGAFVLVSVLVFASAAPHRNMIARVLGWSAMALGLILACALIGVGGYTGTDWAFLGLLAVGTIILARLKSSYEPFAYFAAAAVLAMLLIWEPLPAELTRFAVTAASLIAALVVVPFACIRNARHPHRWASFCAAVGTAGLIVVYLSPLDPEFFGGWLAIAVGIAVLYAGGAALVHRNRESGEPWVHALSAMVLAVVILLALGAFMQLQQQWITIAWALMLPLLALAMRWLRLDVLAWATWGIAGLVLIRTVFNPAIVNYQPVEHFFWTWLLYGYGVPIACFIAASQGFSRLCNLRNLGQCLIGGAILLGGVFILLLTHQAYHPGEWLKQPLFLDEIATAVTALLLLGTALLAADWRWPQPALRRGGAAVTAFATGMALLTAVLIANPLWHSPNLHVMPIWLAVLLAYVLPASLVGLAGWRVQRAVDPRLAAFFNAGALTLGIAGATIFIRMVFHGQDLTLARFVLTEWGVLSTVWLAIAIGLLHAARTWPQTAMLRQLAAVWTVVATAQVIAAQCLLDNPLFVSHAIHGIVVFNTLLLVYALPAGMLAWAARQLHLGIEPGIAKAVGVIALGVAVLAVTLLVRHAFHGQDMTLAQFNLNEWGVLSTAWILAGLALLRAAMVWPSQLLRMLAVGWILIAAAQVLLMQGLIDSPLFWSRHQVQGTIIFNSLLLTYALPAILLAVAGRMLHKHIHPLAGHVVTAVATLVLFLLVSLQVRHAFQGSTIAIDTVQQAEWYAYSVAWIVLAGALLAAGLVTGGKLLRFASLLVMLLAVAKVFLFDAAHLQDLYRVLSFMGLGVSLLLLAWVYQRFVFTRPRPSEQSSPGAALEPSPPPPPIEPTG